MKIIFVLIFIYAIKMNSQTLNYLIVGKGGDSFNQRCGGTGGGAGGGLSQGALTATTGTFAVVVGVTSGSGNSSALGFTATEGGYGGWYDGGGEELIDPTTGGQGSGGSALFGCNYTAASGAGAGTTATIDGLTYATGGVGGSAFPNTLPNSDGTANTGNGARGCDAYASSSIGSTGGSGIVKFKYVTGQVTATGGTITTGGGNTTHTFTSDGNFIVTAVSGGQTGNGVSIFFK